MTDPTSSPLTPGVTVPNSFRQAVTQQEDRYKTFARRAKRNDVIRFLLWAVATLVMVTAVGLPRDYWGPLGIVMGAIVLGQAWVLWDRDKARDYQLAVIFEAQYTAARAMATAYAAGELDKRDGA